MRIPLPWNTPRGGQAPLPLQPETAAAHVRNALALLRLTMETGEVTIGNDGPGVVMPVGTCDAMQRRLEAALERLKGAST